MGKLTSVIMHLGSNMGDRRAMLDQAILALQEYGEVTQRSSVFETAPWGNTEQPYFLNQALELNTTLSPEDLLLAIRQIEKAMGRERLEKWGPRVIDLDIIFYGDMVVETPELRIPHPHAHERAFVLLPLLEICPERKHPELEMEVWELYDQCTDVTEVYLPDVPL